MLTSEKTLEILQRARQLVAAGWVKGKYATNASGREVPIDNYDAVCFCLRGALVRSGQEHCDTAYLRGVKPYELARDLVNQEIAKERPASYWTAIEFNDAPWTTHADVLKVMDMAIAGCKVKES